MYWLHQFCSIIDLMRSNGDEIYHQIQHHPVNHCSELSLAQRQPATDTNTTIVVFCVAQGVANTCCVFVVFLFIKAEPVIDMSYPDHNLTPDHQISTVKNPT